MDYLSECGSSIFENRNGYERFSSHSLTIEVACVANWKSDDEKFYRSWNLDHPGVIFYHFVVSKHTIETA